MTLNVLLRKYSDERLSRFFAPLQANEKKAFGKFNTSEEFPSCHFRYKRACRLGLRDTTYKQFLTLETQLAEWRYHQRQAEENRQREIELQAELQVEAARPRCPQCNGSWVQYRKKKPNFICRRCGNEFDRSPNCEAVATSPAERVFKPIEVTVAERRNSLEGGTSQAVES